MVFWEQQGSLAARDHAFAGLECFLILLIKASKTGQAEIFLFEQHFQEKSIPNTRLEGKKAKDRLI